MIIGFSDGTDFTWCGTPAARQALAIWWFCSDDCEACASVGERVAAELSRWPDDFPTGEPPVFGENDRSRQGASLIGFSDPYETAGAWRAHSFFFAPHIDPEDVERYPWLIEQGKAISRELRTWLYHESDHESWYDPPTAAAAQRWVDAMARCSSDDEIPF